MEYFLPFYPRNGLYLYHSQKNEENPDLNFLSPIFERQNLFRRPIMVGDIF